MHAKSSIEHIFPNIAFMEVLAFFMMHPHEETYLARIVRSTGQLLIQVQRAVKRLKKTGLIVESHHGNRVFYRANRSHSSFNDLKRIILRSKILSTKLEPELGLIRDRIDFGFIFGSIAKNAETSLSDIDLFLVGNLTLETVGHYSFALSLELGREVNCVVYSLSELKRKIKEENPFISEVCQSPKIWLLGDEDEFKKICR